MASAETQALEKSYNYVKEHKRYFKKFFRYYVITNSAVYKIVNVIAGIAFFGGIIAWVVNYFKPHNIPSVPIIIVGVVLLAILGLFDDAMLEIYFEEIKCQHFLKVYNTLHGLSDIYYTPARLKKMLKLMRSGRCASIKEAADSLGLRKTKPRVVADVLNANIQRATEEYNKKIEKKAEKESRKSEEAVFAIFGIGVLLKIIWSVIKLIFYPLYLILGGWGDDFKGSSADRYLQSNKEYYRKQLESDRAYKEKHDTLLKQAEEKEKEALRSSGYKRNYLKKEAENLRRDAYRR